MAKRKRARVKGYRQVRPDGKIRSVRTHWNPKITPNRLL